MAAGVSSLGLELTILGCEDLKLTPPDFPRGSSAEVPLLQLQFPKSIAISKINSPLL